MAATYRALTRKYRPQHFEDVVSQEHVSSTLKNAIRHNRLSHAYMFCGPRGVGKTTMARVLARAINQIDESVDGESLSRTLNVVEIDAASNNKVEDVHYLREVVRVPPQNGRYKVFIIDEVHMLTKQAFNALLKTLEEPPPHAIFIFATTEPHKVLPTILSRVQRFDFKRIRVDEIVSRLEAICREEEIAIDAESLHTIAKRADGALRDALGLMDQAIAFCGTTITYSELVKALNVVGNDELFEYTDAIAGKDAQSGLLLADRLLKDGVDIQEFLASLTQHLRNIYVAKNSSRMFLVEATEETGKRYQQAAEAFDEADLLRLLHLVSEAQLKIREVEQPRVHFEILLLKMVHMSRSSDLEELLSLAKELKKNSGNQLSSTNRKSESGEDAAEIRGDNFAAEQRSVPDQRSESRPPQRVTASSAASRTGKNSGKPGMRYDTGNPNETGEEKGGKRGIGSERGDPGAAAGVNREPRGSEEEINRFRSREEEERELGRTGNANRDLQEAESGNSRSLAEMVEMNRSGSIRTGSIRTVEKNTDTEFENLITGNPVLGFLKQEVPAVRQSGPEKDTVLEDPSPKVLPGLGDIEQKWEAVLSSLEQKAPSLLYLQIKDAKLKTLKGAELVIAVNNPFAVNIVEENKDLIGTICREIYGVYIRLECVMERQKKTEKSLSPFDRFLELQRKDPALKTIVELFGAEIEYR